MALPGEDLQAFRQKVRSQPAQPWWWWDVEERPTMLGARITRSFEVELPWSYVRPDPRPGPWWHHDLNTRRLEGLLASVIDERVSRMPGQAGERAELRRQSQRVAHDAVRAMREKPLGSMVCIALEWWYRGHHQYLLTPPVHKFCDLDKGFPNAPDILKPFDFWIQPTVFEHTGEILQGGIAPALRTTEDDIRALRHTPRPRVLRSILNDEKEFAAELEYVHVALDAYLERGEADPEFIWSWKEEREQKYGAHQP